MKSVTILLLVVFIHTTTSLFNNEEFLYNGRPAKLERKYTIRLVQTATVPQTNGLSTVCQVPTFQMQAFVNRTGFPIQQYSPGKKRGLDTQCQGVEYCDNGGTAGWTFLCLGKVHTIADAECVDRMYNDLINQQNRYNQELLKASRDTAKELVNEATDVLEEQLKMQLNAQQQLLQSAISTTELALITAVENSTAISMKKLEETANSVASQASTLLSNLQDASQRQYANTQTQIASLANMQATSSETLYKAITDSTLLSATRLHNLSTYLDTVVSSINTNNFAVYLNMQSTTKIIQQLAAKLEKISRFELQGVDISNLLMQWANVKPETVFQDTPTTQYEYFSSGLYGSYPSPVAYDMNQELDAVVSAIRVYNCTERGSAAPLPSIPSLQDQVTILNMNISGCTSITVSDRDSILLQGPAWVVTKIKSSCATNTAAYDAVTTQATKYYSTITYTARCTVSPFQVPNVYEVAYVTQGVSITATSSTCTVSSATPGWSFPAALPVSTSVVDTDGPKYFYALGRNMNLQNEVSRSTTIYSYFWGSANNAVRAYSPTQTTGTATLRSYTYVHTPTAIPTVEYGKSAVLNHPKHGVITIHSCTPIAANKLLYKEGTALGITTDMGYISTQGYPNTGTVYTDITGTSKSTIEILTSADGTRDEAVRYHYSPDMWCCDEMMRPIATVTSTSQCSRMCRSAQVGICGGIPTKLTAASTCPVGTGALTSGSVHTRYKSPRVYFCSGGRKFAEPYGIDVEACSVDTIPLPGAGVEIQTGTISPQGMYPAACIYYSKVSGVVPLYRIEATFENQIVPTLISNLNGRKLLYRQQAGKIIDEMGRLYGIGNSGYDCLTYEMDKFLHQPRACLSYDIPEYDMVAYFSGKVRTDGLSSNLDYFDIIPRPSTTAGVLEVDFVLKDGIDYEAAYINNVNLCPSLQVSYNRTQDGVQYCLLSGWSSTQVNLTVAGINVNGGVNPVRQVSVSDGIALDVVIYYNGDNILCNRFQCKASTNTFVAYPVDTFSTRISRPNLASYIGSQSGYSYAAELQNLLNRVSNTLTANLANVEIPALGDTTINTTIVVRIVAPDLTAIIEAISRNMTGIRELTADTFQAIMREAGVDIQDLRNALKDSIDGRYANLSALLEKWARDANLPPVEDQTYRMDAAKVDAQTAHTLSIVSIVVSAVTVATSLFFVLKKKICKNKGSKKSRDKSVELESAVK